MGKGTLDGSHIQHHTDEHAPFMKPPAFKLPRFNRQQAMRAVVRLRQIMRNDQMVLGFFAIIVGVLAALGEIVFRQIIEWTQALVYGAGERLALGDGNGETDESIARDLSDIAATLPWWEVLLIPVIGGLFIGLMLKYIVPEHRHGAIPEVIEASAMQGGRIGAKRGFLAALASAFSLGFGASGGREGPVVHLGATLASIVGTRAHMPRKLQQTLLGCGIAGAVAAAFNAPIAGVFFALEVVLGSYALNAFAPVVISAVVATLISRARYGDFPAFILPPMDIASHWEFPLFALLGLFCAIVAAFAMYSIIIAEEACDNAKIPKWLRPACGGVVVGILAIMIPQVLGVGYAATDTALDGTLGLGLLLALMVGKIIATGACLGTGFTGGVFSPALFIGAMAGGTFGNIVARLIPSLSDPGTYATLGMAAVAGALMGAPISTILIVFELTGDYAITVGIMIAVVLSSLIFNEVFGQSLFHWQLARRGVKLRQGRYQKITGDIAVSTMMRHAFTKIAHTAKRDDIIGAIRTARFNQVFVVGDDDRLMGVITLPDITARLEEREKNEEAEKERTAGDLCRRDPPYLRPGSTLDAALNLFDTTGETHIPVVDSLETMRIIGVVDEHKLMKTYYSALLENREEARATEREAEKATEKEGENSQSAPGKGEAAAG